MIPEYFDSNAPTVSTIRERYGPRFKDMSVYKGLTHNDICEALFDVGHGKYGRSGFIVPEVMDVVDGKPVYTFWDMSDTVRINKEDIPLDARRFMKFAPEIDLFKRSITLREMKEKRMTPRKLFREVLGSKETREKLLKGAYRGIGWWDPKTKVHKLLPFIVLPEGHRYASDYKSRIDFSYQYSDAYVIAPSISEDYIDKYIVDSKVLPVTKEGDAYLYEWAMTTVPAPTKGGFIGSAGGRKKIDDKYRSFYKYANAEQRITTQGMGVLELLQERSKKDPEIDTFLIDYPIATGIMSPWHTLSVKTIVKGIKGGEKRPLKTQINKYLGTVIGYAGPESMVDLSEEPLNLIE